MLDLPYHLIEHIFMGYANLFAIRIFERSNYKSFYTSCNSLSDSFLSTYSNIAT